MSNNPPLPPPNMDDFEATMIREDNPLMPVGDAFIDRHFSPELVSAKTGPVKKVKPRRAKPRNLIWTYIALGAYFAIAGFIGCLLGLLIYDLSRR